MKKKILLSLALIAMLVSIFAISVFAANPVAEWDISKTENDSVTANLYNDENNSGYYTLIISGTGNMKSWNSQLDVPWSSYRGKIKSAKIDSGVTGTLGSYAFYECAALKSIIIPNGITSIGERSFNDCTSLTGIVIPEGVKTIGYNAFRGCTSLGRVVLPESLKVIRQYGFYTCSSLSSIYIPSGVTEIDGGTFFGCTSLKIYCGAAEKPNGWHNQWNLGVSNVVWGHTHSYKYSFDSSSHFGTCVCGSNTTEPHTINDYECFCGYTEYVEKWQAGPSVYAYLVNDPNNVGYYILTISGTGEMMGWTTAPYAPWYSTDYNSCITSVTIEEGVTTIGDYAFFYCLRLASIVIPDSVTSIGEAAFKDCYKLTNIVIPDSVISIGGGAFYLCTSLTNVELPDSVTSIGRYAFHNCGSLTSIVIPDSVTSIGDDAFSYCKSLTSITVDENNQAYKSIDGILYTKDGTTLIQYAIGKKDISFTIPESVTSIGYEAFYGCESLTSIVIPNSVTSMGNYAFESCYNLTIYCEAESQPSGWNSDWNPDNRPVVWGHSHSYENHKCVCGKAEPCVEMWDISKTENDSVYAYLFDDENNSGYYTLTISGTGDMNDFTTTAPWRSYRSKITSATIEYGVTSIGDSAFRVCENLKSISISDSVTSIGSYAFGECSKLTYIDLPEGLTTIYDHVFSYCKNITRIDIPDSVTTIYNYGLHGCYNLREIYVGENNQSYMTIDGILYTKDGTTLIVYPSSKYESTFEIPEHVTTISDGAFTDCDRLTHIAIPESVTYIGGDAFHHCTNLESIVILGGVTSINSGTFLLCERLTSVVIPDSVTYIGQSAFSHCSSLTSIVIPDSVTSIDNYAFRSCSALTSIVIPEGVTYIGIDAFESCYSLTIYCEAESQPSEWNSSWNIDNCPVVWGHSHAYENRKCVCGKAEPCVEMWDISNTENDSVYAYLSDDENNSGYYTLTISGTGEMMGWTSFSNVTWCSYSSKITSVTIEEGVTSIGDCAFSQCTSLTSIVIPDSVTYIGDYAFSYCQSLTSVVIPEGVPSIGVWAFYTCYNLTSIVIPDSVTSIGNSAFFYCDSLTSIVIPEGVSSIDNGAFQYCMSLTSIVIPEGVTYIGDYAFSSCDNLTSIVISESVTSIGESAFSYCSSLTSIVIPEGVIFVGDFAFSDCDSLTIYCKAESQPSGWNSYWNYSKCPVVWGYFDENACLNSIFTFKGYSFSANGGFAVGFAIDYDALAQYEAKTGKTLEIGVVFAGYNNLGGKQPLDETGKPISLDVGMVKKANITGLTYKYYDFMLSDVSDSVKDTKLVIAGYIFDGDSVQYVQENGLCDTVSGITYNEAQQS